jgi:hypothetical protein
MNHIFLKFQVLDAANSSCIHQRNDCDSHSLPVFSCNYQDRMTDEYGKIAIQTSTIKTTTFPKYKKMLFLCSCILFHHKLDNQEHNQCNNSKINNSADKITD